MKRPLRSLLLAAAAIALASPADAKPVEYLRACDPSLYGEGFYYRPGSDTCFHPLTGEVGIQTSGGAWRTFQAKPGTWVRSARAGCQRGRLVEIGTFGPEDLTINSHRRWETEPVPLTLAEDEFIANVMFRGGFDATNQSTLCLSFHELADYWVLGCHHTSLLRNQIATWSFGPVHSTPPADFTSPLHLVAHAADERWGIKDPPPVPPAVDLPPGFTGEITISVCVQHPPRLRP